MPKTKRASDGSDEHTSKKKELPLYGNKNPNECKYAENCYGIIICTGNACPCASVSDENCPTTDTYKDIIANLWRKR